MSWQKLLAKELKKEKYVRDGTELNINIAILAKEVIRKGRYGDRTLFLVEDTKLGTVLLSPKQFTRLGLVIGDLTTGIINTTA